MATIKSHTDLKQSKMLAEILSLESADMFCADVFDKEKETHSYNFHILSTWGCNTFEELKDRENRFVCFIPCWSLVALLEQLKSEIILENKQILFLHFNKYNDINYEIRYTNSWSGEVLITKADNLVDACVEMIIKLKEKGLL